jgi:hypothetical protein
MTLIDERTEIDKKLKLAAEKVLNEHHELFQKLADHDQKPSATNPTNDC